MRRDLEQREADGRFIQVGLVGAGSMGQAIAYQIGITPGLRLSFVADLDPVAARQAAARCPHPVRVLPDALAALRDPAIPCDVLVEATNSIVPAHDYCRAAIERKAHCVLMNAEVDAILGRLLRHHAARQGVLVTSDAGDQHGVLARLIEEVRLWGLTLVQAGNMKGFLDRHRTLAGSIQIARDLRLSPRQCLAYTDGSKLNIEMSIIANEYGLLPQVPGMSGPAADRVEDVLDRFPFDAYEGRGRIDYILGAKQHRSGVYVVGRCDDAIQAFYFNYYKVAHRHPYYLFFRPYHLCHLETPRAIALAALYGKAVCTQRQGRVTDCYAYAKCPLVPGARIEHGIGSDEVYGLVMDVRQADRAGLVPQGLLEVEAAADRPRLRRSVARDQPLTWDDVDLPETRLLELWRQQEALSPPPGASP